MPLDQLINLPCTLTQRVAGTTSDELGDEVRNVNAIETVCMVQRLSADELAGAGEAATGLWNIFFPTGTVVRTGDAVEVDDYGVFEMVSDGWDLREGSADMWHVEVRAKQTLTPEEVGS